MGISNRDYIRDEPPTWGGGGGGGFAPASDHWAIKSIIIACVVVFFAQTLTGQPHPRTGNLYGGVSDWLDLSWQGLMQFRIWGLVTHGFCHGSIQHLFWNMVGLYVFSRSLEDVYGSRELFAFFVVTVMISGLVEIGIGRATGHHFGVYGASGGLMGILLLAAWQFPRRPLNLLFLPISFELRWLAAVYVIGDIVQTLGGPNGVANFAHLSGGLVGYFYFQWGGRILPTSGGYSTRRRRGGLKRFLSRLKPSRVKPSVRLYEPPASETESASGLDSEVDRLLDKINREGKESLTPEENEILLKASKTYRNRV